MARPKSPTAKTLISIRLDAEQLERIQAVAAVAAPAGLKIGVTDVIRMCLARALPELEAEHMKPKRKK